MSTDHPSAAGAQTGRPDPPGVRQTRVVSQGDLEPRTWAALDDLHARTGAPVTARRTWLQTWMDCFTSYQSFAVLVEDGDGAAGAALLAFRRRHGLTIVRSVGHAMSDQVRFPALDPAAATQLAIGVAGALQGLPRPWRLDVEQLPPDDPVVAALRRQLPWAEVRSGDPSPTVRFTRGRALRSYISRNHHQASRRLVNRMRRADLATEVEVLSQPADIAALLPDLERICRQRDHQLGRLSQFDDPEGGPFFHEVVRRLAENGEVALTTLRLGSQLVAYVLSFVDGSVHRMWNTRFDPRLAQFGPGRLAVDAALGAALADESIVEFDWMRGDEPYKASTATDVVPAVRLVAWSSQLLGGAETDLRWAKARARRRMRSVARVACHVHPRHPRQIVTRHHGRD
jgi:CelD/BcsL family acetyltransferase involved in cellulose biosynthesis